MSDVGSTRLENQDRYAVVESHGLYVVAHGIGEHAAGATAATIAVDVVVESFTATDLSAPRRPEQRLVRAIEQANRTVYETAISDSANHGMGTTCVVASISRDSLSIVHVGDSRAFRMRDGDLLQITRDHSVAEEYRLELVTNPPSTRRANAPTPALGLRETVDVSVTSRPVAEGDKYLLCSDGLTSVVPASSIARIMALAATVEDACSSLVEHAKRYGGMDNITAIVIALD